MAPGPDADQPRTDAVSTGGSASTPHADGSAVHCVPSPHIATGATRPVTSATSNPGGNPVRVRPTFAGSITEFTAGDDAAAPDVAGSAGSSG